MVHLLLRTSHSVDYLASYTTYLIDTLVDCNVISPKVVRNMTCTNICQ